MASKSLCCVLAPESPCRQAALSTGRAQTLEKMGLPENKGQGSSQDLLGCISQLQMQCSRYWLESKDLAKTLTLLDYHYQ